MPGPEQYDAWYETRRGAWIGEREYRLVRSLAGAMPSASILDVGSGTGYFSRRFAADGYRVVALDPDRDALRFAALRAPAIAQVNGAARALPFAAGSFDHVIAITSLCFVGEPVAALAELYRVSRRSCVLGLLNRRSLLHHRKAGTGAYRGARWDSGADVRNWLRRLGVADGVEMKSAVFLPAGGLLSRCLEHLVPETVLAGGFLAVSLRKPAGG